MERNSTNETWEDLFSRFIDDCKKANKTLIEPSDFMFWLDYEYHVPEKLNQSTEQ